MVIGAAGAVGQPLVVLGKLAGCEVWGVASSSHAKLVASLGATHIDGDTVDYACILQERFDVVFDGIAEQGFTRAWRAIERRRHLTAIGVSAGVKRSVVGRAWVLADEAMAVESLFGRPFNELFFDYRTAKITPKIVLR